MVKGEKRKQEGKQGTKRTEEEEEFLEKGIKRKEREEEEESDEVNIRIPLDEASINVKVSLFFTQVQKCFILSNLKCDGLLQADFRIFEAVHVKDNA